MSIQFLDPDGQLPEPARSRLSDGFALLMDAQYDEALSLFREHLRDENPVARGFACLYLGDLYHFQWEFPMCMQSYERAAAAFAEADHARGRIMTALRVADIYVDETASDKTATPEQVATAERRAHETLDRAAAEAEELDDGFLVAFALHYRALFATEQKRWEDAVIDASRAADLREQIGDLVYGPSSSALLARAKAELGDHDAAVELAERTFEVQMERHLRGSALRTLSIISHIRDLQHLSRTKSLTAQFTAVEPVARTPFIFGDRPLEELEVAAHGAGMETPFAGTERRLQSARKELVQDAALSVQMLQS